MIPCQRSLFDLPDDVAYFNCAYMSPLMKPVVAAGEAGVARKARPWQITPPDFFTGPEKARGLFAELIGGEADNIAVIPAASYGIAAAARNIPIGRNQRVVVLASQFPSNVYVWRERTRETGGKFTTVKRPDNGDWTSAILDAIDDDTAVVATANCHWTDGGLIDVAAVGSRCREVGAAFVLDLTQSIGALPFDVQAAHADFAIAACYKWMMGPYSLGFMHVAPRYHEGRPLEHNWMARAGSEDFTALVNYQNDFQPGARRFDMGETANFHLLPMAIAALEQLLAWTPAAVQTTLTEMTGSIAARAEQLGLIASDPRYRAGHFLGLRFPGGPPDGLLERLAQAQVHVSLRGDSMRVTPHVYNNTADIDRLIDTLQSSL